MTLLMKIWQKLLLAAGLVPALLLIGACASCGGGGGTTSTTTPSVPAPAPVRTGTLLSEASVFYPRLVRLAHQSDASLNGAVIASAMGFEGSQGQGRLFISRDDGASYAPLGTVSDSRWPKGLCCGSIFELRSPVGALPAGTLLWSASIGQDTPGTAMTHPIYRSGDGGKTWTALGATCGVGRKPRNGDGTGIWEPEFQQAKDGTLVCMYSDETDDGASQVLKITTTADGVSWTAPRLLVAAVKASDRPGMAVTTRLGDGSYLMSYEFCSTAGLDCRVYLKRSADGLDWGSPTDRGFEPKTADGRWFRHAPTVVWLPASQRLALVGQILNTSAGSVDATGNGATVFLSSTADGSGTWTTVPAPVVPLSPPTQTNWCQNYSSPLLPSADGKQLLMLGSDFEMLNGAQVCRTRFGRGALPG
ncbi:sialidase family protein [Roseateles sp. BYS87W]|uniref:Sialidase family protein n=1 Tax=Pelomonas baiyunensis TaxID=3299026 RepID=A0ABW7GT37_9BURK